MAIKVPPIGGHQIKKPKQLESRGGAEAFFAKGIKKRRSKANLAPAWCERGDLNSHVGCHTPLKRACLPVPALSQIALVFHAWSIIAILQIFVNQKNEFPAKGVAFFGCETGKVLI